MTTQYLNYKIVNLNRRQFKFDGLATDLVVLVTETEILQKLMSQPHQLVHSHVFFGIKGNLQQVQDHLESRDLGLCCNYASVGEN